MAEFLVKRPKFVEKIFGLNSLSNFMALAPPPKQKPAYATARANPFKGKTSNIADRLSLTRGK